MKNSNKRVIILSNHDIQNDGRVQKQVYSFADSDLIDKVLVIIHTVNLPDEDQMTSFSSEKVDVMYVTPDENAQMDTFITDLYESVEFDPSKETGSLQFAMMSFYDKKIVKLVNRIMRSALKRIDKFYYKKDKLYPERERFYLAESIKRKFNDQIRNAKLLKKYMDRFFSFTSSSNARLNEVLGNYHIIVANDLQSLPFAAKIRKDHAIVYDAHELEFERANASAEQRALLKTIEKHYIRFSDKQITVSDKIRDKLVETYGLDNIHMIYNYPCFQRPCSKNVKDDCRLTGQDRLLIFLGGALPARGIDNLIKIMAYLPENYHLALISWRGDYDNPFINTLESLAEDLKVRERLHVLPFVDSTEVVSYISSADAGLYITNTDSSLNQRYSMPNKLFEYLDAGLPVFVNSGMESIAEVISTHQAGRVVEKVDDHEATAAIIEEYFSEQNNESFDRGFLERYKWENNVENYINL